MYPKFEDYEVIRRIGKGGYSTVYLCRCYYTNKQYAIKMIECKSDYEFNENLKEALFIAKLSHENIVPIQSVFRHVENNCQYLCIVMTFYENATLLDLLLCSRIPEENIKKIALQIASALEFIHSRNLIHRDVKPENIFIEEKSDKYVKVVLGDFGLTRELRKSIVMTLCGTECYMSPEMRREKKYDEKVDIWALGCVIYQMMTNNVKDMYVYMLENTKRWGRILRNDLKKYNKDFVNLVLRMLNKEGEKRPTAKEIVMYLSGKEFETRKEIYNEDDWKASYFHLRSKYINLKKERKQLKEVFRKKEEIYEQEIFKFKKYGMEMERLIENERQKYKEMEEKYSKIFENFVMEAEVLRKKISERENELEKLKKRFGLDELVPNKIKLHMTLYGHTKEIQSMCISNDEKYIYSGDGGLGDSIFRIYIWDFDNYNLIESIDAHQASINSLAITNDDRKLISASGDRFIKIWNTKTKKLDSFREMENGISNLKLLKDECLVVSQFDGTIVLLDLNRFSELKKIETNSILTSLCITHDGSIMITGHEKEIKFWNLEREVCIQTIKGNEGLINMVILSKKENYIITCCSYDKNIKIYAKDGNLITTIHNLAYCINTDINDKYLILTTNDITLIDLETRTILNTLRGHNSFINSIISTKHCILSCSNDKTIKIWK